MTEIAWTREAAQQLVELLTPIADEDPELAGIIAERIEKALLRLSMFPESAPLYPASDFLRRLSVPRLPYSCYDEYIEGVVRVLSIRHDRQNRS